MGHVASSEKNCCHDKCPKGSESWCKYQADKANGTRLYTPGNGLDTTIIKHIKSIFVDLCKDELLKKCLDSKTQNQNESFNGTVWNRLQKTTYVDYHKLSLGVYDAVAVFNNGHKTSIDIYENMNMRPDSLRDRFAGNKIGNVYTLLNTKIMKAQKSDEK